MAATNCYVRTSQRNVINELSCNTLLMKVASCNVHCHKRFITGESSSNASVPEGDRFSVLRPRSA